MSYILVKTKAFERNARKLLKKNPDFFEDIYETLQLLSENPYFPQLKTHKLKGKFEGILSCSAGYDLRITFNIVQVENQETKALEDTILLYSIGTHDEIY